MAVKPRPATLACTISVLAAIALATLAGAAAVGPGQPRRAGGGNGLGKQRPRHGQVAHGRHRQPDGDRGGPGDAARRRQRRRCRRRRPAGPQPGRAAVLGARRRRLHPALGCGEPAAQGLRRAGDGAGRRHCRPVPGRRPAAQVRRRGVRRPERRRARHAAPCSKPCIAGTAGCRGRGSSRRRSGSPPTAFASRRACTCCCAGTARKASRRRRADTSSIRPAAPARPATCSATPSSPPPCAPSPSGARRRSTRAPIAEAIVKAVREAAQPPGRHDRGRSRRLCASRSAIPSASSTGAIACAAWARPPRVAWPWPRS